MLMFWKRKRKRKRIIIENENDNEKDGEKEGEETEEKEEETDFEFRRSVSSISLPGRERLQRGEALVMRDREVGALLALERFEPLNVLFQQQVISLSVAYFL